MSTDPQADRQSDMEDDDRNDDERTNDRDNERSDERDDEKGDDRTEARLGSITLFGKYCGKIDRQLLFCFCPVTPLEREPEEGEIVSIKYENGIRGHPISTKKAFPHSLTLYVRYEGRNRNLVIWVTPHIDPETGETFSKVKICGPKDRDLIESVTKKVFEHFHSVLQNQLFLLENRDLAEEYLEWLYNSVEISDEWTNGAVSFSHPEVPEHFPREMVEFFDPFLDEPQADQDSMFLCFDLLFQGELACTEDLELIGVEAVMFKLSFDIPFVIHYGKLRDVINALFDNGFQRKFYVVYFEHQNSKCVVHCQSPAPPEERYVFLITLGNKSAPGKTTATLESNGLDPDDAMKNFWDLVHEYQNEISVC